MPASADLFVSAREAWLYDSKLASDTRIAALYLARRFEMTPGWHPRYQDIAEQCGITKYAAQKSMRELKAAGYLTGGQKIRIAGQWRNTPLRVAPKLRDAAIYWQSPGFRSPKLGDRTSVSEATYSQTDNHTPKDSSGQEAHGGNGKEHKANETAPAVELPNCGACESRGTLCPFHLRHRGNG